MKNSSPVPQEGWLPNFLIMGAMRSGTTTLAMWLRQLPDVYMATPKELHFFDEFFGRGLTWYSSFFEGAGVYKIRGEATPGYLYQTGLHSRIASCLPGAKLLVILRNPADRAYSHYWWNRARGFDDLDFVDAVSAEPERLSESAVRYSYVDRGRYASQLSSLMRYFPVTNLKVVLFDDLMANPDDMAHLVTDFLGIENGGSLSSIRANEHSFVLSKRLFALTQRMPLKTRIWTRRRIKRPASYPPLDPSDRARVIDLLSHEIDRLESLLERDLTAWRE